ncbi:4284_t:CDS:2 [Paraglomus brasilianum]|uniref:4284_t:CDS:1 n=1 Tax=Paraglomus brasilianum TaxID=144538 RepID=A0A9N9HEA8_9GLOM|nr:4284_t:CDS:2 [Paraglomus brasilianum]
MTGIRRNYRKKFEDIFAEYSVKSAAEAKTRWVLRTDWKPRPMLVIRDSGRVKAFITDLDQLRITSYQRQSSARRNTSHKTKKRAAGKGFRYNDK